MTSINSTTGMVSDTSASQRDAFRAKVRSLVAAAREAKGATQVSEAARGTKASGTVSSAVSSAWKSGLSTAGAAAIGAGGTSIAPTVDTAETLVGWLASDINDYNGKFELQSIPTREEHEASQQNAVATWRAEGLSDQLIANSLEYNYGKGGYERYVRNIENHNQGLLRSSEIAEDRLHNAAAQRLNEGFGVKVKISYDTEGRASVAPFGMYYRDGQKMLSFSEDGSLTSYNTDGTVKLALSNKEAAKIAMGYYRS